MENGNKIKAIVYALMAAVFYALNMPLSKVLLTDRSGKEMYWNHNSAYYSWVKKTVTNCTNILDVGCGEGSLVRFLDDGNKKTTGIDVDGPCIEKAKALSKSDKEEFLCCDFEEYTTEKVFDAIIFVASIHHMDMVKAIEIAKSLLSPSGKLIIVGLSKPSSLLDWIIEIGRVIPSKIISTVNNIQNSEELNVPVSYELPKMDEVRSTVKRLLPGAGIRYGLHYRYLLVWNKTGN